MREKSQSLQSDKFKFKEAMVSFRDKFISFKLVCVFLVIFLVKNGLCAEIQNVQKRTDGDSYLDALKTSHSEGEVTREFNFQQYRKKSNEIYLTAFIFSQIEMITMYHIRIIQLAYHPAMIISPVQNMVRPQQGSDHQLVQRLRRYTVHPRHTDTSLHFMARAMDHRVLSTSIMDHRGPQ